MTVAAKSTRTAQSPRSFAWSFKDLMNWVVEKDQTYRQARKLADMPDERLKDMGMTRRDADTAFYDPKG